MQIFRGVDKSLAVYRYRKLVFCSNHHLRRTIMSYYQPSQEREYLALADHGLWVLLVMTSGTTYQYLLALVTSGLLHSFLWTARVRSWIISSSFLADSKSCLVESYCVPHFDSPSVFARILDKDKGGHFSIQPTIPYTSKQNYLPSSNVLQTKFMNDAGVVSVTGMPVVIALPPESP